MIRVIRKIRNLCFKTISVIFYLFPIKKNKLIFLNFFGKGFGCNPKYIALELLKENKYDLVWIVSDLNDSSVPEGIRKVKINSLKSYFELITAKVWVFNIRNFHPVRKRKNQIYLQTWHGGLALKKVEAETSDSLSKNYVKWAKYDGKIVDGFISENHLTTIKYKNYFWLHEKAEILEYGIPRNDFLFKNKNNPSIKDEVCDFYGIGKEDYIVLYAPTFRDDGNMTCFNMDFKKVVSAFSKRLNKNVKLIVRLHPNIQNRADFIEYDDTILNGSKYPDMQKLSVAADCLISDYSSTLFEFVYLLKPAFVFALDYDVYKRDRGLVDDYLNMPFIYSFSNEELLCNIESFSMDKCIKEMNFFMNENSIYTDGNSSKKAVEWIKFKIN